MKIKPGYVLRKIVDVFVILGTDKDTYVPDQVMSLNDTGALLWDILKDETTEETLVDCLMKEYQVSEETAVRDVEIFLTQLRDNGLIDG